MLINNEEFQKKKKLLVKKSLCKQHIEQYLQELNSVFMCPVLREELLSQEESEILFEKIAANKIHEVQSTLFKKELPFEEKKQPMASLINILNSLYGGNILVTMGYSEHCGIAEIPSITCLNPNFHFTDEHSGLIVLRTSDLTNYLLLDFYEDLGEHSIIIEANGPQWNIDLVRQTLPELIDKADS